MSGYQPYGYNKINLAAGIYNPSAIKAQNNDSYAFWERALFQRVISVFEFNLIPEWDGATKDFILYCLFRNGYLGCAYDSKFGNFMQPCTVSGYDFYYQPIEFIVSNPLLSKTYKIGEDGEIFKLTPDYLGIWDIIDYYAIKLSHLDNGINQSIINSKFAWILGAKNKAAASALKKIMDLVQKGEPLVVYDQRILDDQQSKSEPWQFVDFGAVKEKYLTTEMLENLATILNQFDVEIGIPAIPYKKKERMVTSEAESKQVESIARATVWLETMQNSLIKVNKLLGTNMSVDFRFDVEEGVEEDEQFENNNAGI